MDLRLGQGDRDAEHPATLVGADADRREHGGVADDPAVAHLLVARVEDQIPDLAERPGAPGLQLVVEQFGGAAAAHWVSTDRGGARFRAAHRTRNS